MSKLSNTALLYLIDSTGESENALSFDFRLEVAARLGFPAGWDRRNLSAMIEALRFKTKNRNERGY